MPLCSCAAVLNSSADRDECHFADPDSFDIHWRIDRHLAFGHGPNFCLGASPAGMEGRLALDEVLRRWTDWDIDYEGTVLHHTSTTTGWKRLPVVAS
ncbi:cytochrome P450 [Parafrankia sp. EUN1f]|uniref:cytochrome P450 n=1 Tax=Parafrankia sp. EUN1f TaxID=102897 RepID=UPI0001C46292|nr:cytochrome P450 [Parafrankia sp. EUN1f]EFC83600.1 Cytochrome P450-like protein [Parafrankia sp. EUN1f]